MKFAFHFFHDRKNQIKFEKRNVVIKTTTCSENCIVKVTNENNVDKYERFHCCPFFHRSVVPSAASNINITHTCLRFLSLFPCSSVSFLHHSLSCTTPSLFLIFIIHTRLRRSVFRLRLMLLVSFFYRDFFKFYRKLFR